MKRVYCGRELIFYGCTSLNILLSCTVYQSLALCVSASLSDSDNVSSTAVLCCRRLWNNKRNTSSQWTTRCLKTKPRCSSFSICSFKMFSWKSLNYKMQHLQLGNILQPNVFFSCTGVNLCQLFITGRGVDRIFFLGGGDKFLKLIVELFGEV